MEEGKDAITSLALSVAFKVLSEATMSIWHTPCHSHYSVPASRACFLLPFFPTWPRLGCLHLPPSSCFVVEKVRTGETRVCGHPSQVV